MWYYVIVEVYTSKPVRNKKGNIVKFISPEAAQKYIEKHKLKKHIVHFQFQ